MSLELTTFKPYYCFVVGLVNTMGFLGFTVGASFLGEPLIEVKLGFTKAGRFRQLEAGIRQMPPAIPSPFSEKGEGRARDSLTHKCPTKSDSFLNGND